MTNFILNENKQLSLAIEDENIENFYIDGTDLVRKI
ncbi:hypothetical protein, partial [Bacillus subtilis]